MIGVSVKHVMTRTSKITVEKITSISVRRVNISITTITRELGKIESTAQTVFTSVSISVMNVRKDIGEMMGIVAQTTMTVRISSITVTSHDLYSSEKIDSISASS
jgi:hypothetical protein